MKFKRGDKVKLTGRACARYNRPRTTRGIVTDPGKHLIGVDIDLGDKWFSRHFFYAKDLIKVSK